MSDFFRANVGCMLINSQGFVLALERVPAGSARWQMAQGGIKKKERPVDALNREMQEELGLAPSDYRLVAEHEAWLAYELPEEARDTKTGRGQVQKWFLAELIADESAINLAASSQPEFAAWRWMSMDELCESTWAVRRPIYEILAKTYSDYLH